MAIIIGALPVTLVNGTPDDATQVMADFNWILSQVNANAAPLTSLSNYLPLTGGTLTGSLSGTSATFSGNLTTSGVNTFNGTLNCNAVNCTAIQCTTISGSGLGITGSSTLVGTVNCNAISCATITTNGNTITAGAITASGTFNGTIIAAGNAIQLNTTAVQALYTSTVQSVRTWSFGTNTDAKFYIQDTSGGSLNRLFIDTTGQVNIPGNVAVGGGGIEYTAFDTQFIAFRFNSGTSLSLFVNSSFIGNQNFNVSDERLKENIVPAKETALAELLGVKLINFDLPDRVNPELPAQHFDYGFSAQQLQTVIPEAVVTSRLHPLEDPSDETVLSLNTDPLLARCVGAIQELTKRIEALEKKA